MHKQEEISLIWNFGRVLNAVFFLLGDSDSFEFYMAADSYTAYEDGTNRVFRNVST